MYLQAPLRTFHIMSINHVNFLTFDNEDLKRHVIYIWMILYKKMYFEIDSYQK